MPEILSDNDIDSLIHEAKVIPAGLLPLGKLAERQKHLRKDFEVKSADATGNDFVVFIRQSTFDPRNFSAILGYKVPGTNAVFRLRRYNGIHEHLNAIEGNLLNDFHIHEASERYQRRGGEPDSFAAPTDRYSSLNSAIQCLLEDCGFNPPPPRIEQMNLFNS